MLVFLLPVGQEGMAGIGMVHMVFSVSFGNRISVMLEWIRNHTALERSARSITDDQDLKIKEVCVARKVAEQRE